MNVDEATAKANRQLDEIIEAKLLEIEALLRDQGATDDELTDALEWQRAALEEKRGELLGMVKRAAVNGPSAVDLH